MIRVVRGETGPAAFERNAARDAQKHMDEYDADPTAYQSGEKRFKVTNTYKMSSLKNALINSQHGKCAFTEAKLHHISYGDVEHWRPKGAVRQSEGAPVERPGYYWLAYDWNNLFIVSTLANQQFKKEIFPLRNPQHRARSHHDDLSREEPLLLHPTRDDPEEHIEFRGEVAFPRDDSERGIATIEVCGLNLEALQEHRLDRYDILKGLYQLSISEEPESKTAQRLMAKFTSDDAEYASMARCAIRDGFQY